MVISVLNENFSLGKARTQYRVKRFPMDRKQGTVTGSKRYSDNNTETKRSVYLSLSFFCRTQFESGKTGIYSPPAAKMGRGFTTSTIGKRDAGDRIPAVFTRP